MGRGLGDLLVEGKSVVFDEVVVEEKGGVGLGYRFEGPVGRAKGFDVVF